jgi:hypothetical protein
MKSYHSVDAELNTPDSAGEVKITTTVDPTGALCTCANIIPLVTIDQHRTILIHFHEKYLFAHAE